MHYLLTQPPQHILYIQYFASMIDNILIEWLVWAIVIDIVTKASLHIEPLLVKGQEGFLSMLQ